MAMSNNKRCEWCWHPTDSRGAKYSAHNNGCPESRGNLEQWNAGWASGFAEDFIPTRSYSQYNPSFILGYRAGKNEIEQLVEAVCADRNS
jgi:hypothetical protein